MRKSHPDYSKSANALAAIGKKPAKNPYKNQVKPAVLANAAKATPSNTSLVAPAKAPPPKGPVKKPISNKQKGLIGFLELTPQERKRRASISRKIRVLLKQRRLNTESLTSIETKAEESDSDKKDVSPKRYRRPIEKLLKKIKLERKDQIPSDINLHRHRYRRASFPGASGTRKEVEIIHDAKHKRELPMQPHFGYDYNKRERRLLLGFRHRKLSEAWNYFGGLKECCPRRMLPNSHLPDGLFFFFNIIIFISVGVPFGFMYACDAYLRLLESIYEYELHTKNLPNLFHEGYDFWIQTLPLDNIQKGYYFSTTGLCTFVILGFVGIYVADQKLHLAYILGMLASLLLGGIVAGSVNGGDELCKEVEPIFNRLLQLLLSKYYEVVEAIAPDGTPVLDDGGSVLKIRTYMASNLMDRLQVSLHCCGVQSIQDYISGNMQVPQSCCNPLWNLNPHCAKVIPTDKQEYRAKLQLDPDKDFGCLEVLNTMCVNLHRMMGASSLGLNCFHWILFLMSLAPLYMQARQIRQLKRWPHLRISAGSISQSLQASAASEGKTGGGGVRAVAEASKFTEKQQERLQQTRRENLFKNIEQEEESSESSEESSDELTVHTVNFGELKNLQKFVDTEDKTKLEMPEIDKTVEGFAGRFNILASKNLQNYVSGIFSSTYQNETNAGLEAIAQSLERQFAQHTTDYNWRKLLTKSKKGKDGPQVTKLGRKSKMDVDSDEDSDDDYYDNYEPDY